MESICKSARYILKLKTDNKSKERALRLNSSAYLPINSLIKLGFTEEKCQNCGLDMDLLHIYFDCYISE